MIKFDRIQDGMAYLGFTKDEIRFILEELEKTKSEHDVTKRIDALYMRLIQEKEWK